MILFPLGSLTQGAGAGGGRVGVLEGRGKTSRERGKKVNQWGWRERWFTVGDELEGQTPDSHLQEKEMCLS